MNIFRKLFKKTKIKHYVDSKSQTSTVSQTSIEFEKEGSFVDNRDERRYRTVRIGNQLWMAENLNYNAGDGCWIYNDSLSRAETYGRLYNWETAKRSAPSGWHLPKDKEWKELEIYLGMNPLEADKSGDRGIAANVGGKLKSISDWKKPNRGATNERSFNALPGGSRSYYENAFFNAGKQAYFWTSTPGGSTTACFRCLEYNSGKISRYDNIGHSTGFSVRCIKDSKSSTSIVSHFLGKWGITEFKYYENLKDLTKQILYEFSNSEANRILYIGHLPFKSPFEDKKPFYKEIISKYNIKHKLFINKKCSLKELCRLTEEIRALTSNTILVSNFPRKWNPPKYQYYDSYGNSIVASAPKGTSLKLCNPNIADCSIAIYFEGIYTVSYIQSILASQGYPLKKPLVCKLLSFSKDNNLLFSQRNELDSANTFEQRQILINACERLEELSQNDAERKDYPSYKGGILLQ